MVFWIETNEYFFALIQFFSCSDVSYIFLDLLAFFRHSDSRLVNDNFYLLKSKLAIVSVKMRSNNLAFFAIFFLISGGQRIFNCTNKLRARNFPLFFELDRKSTR